MITGDIIIDYEMATFDEFMEFYGTDSRLEFMIKENKTGGNDEIY